MKEKLFITGASGFIGYHLVAAALEAGMEVHAAVRPSSDLSFLKKLNANAQDLVYVNADFSSKDKLTKLLEDGGYTYIIHAAGVTKAKTAAAYNLVNAEYSLNLAQAAVSAPPASAGRRSRAGIRAAHFSPLWFVTTTPSPWALSRARSAMGLKYRGN